MLMSHTGLVIAQRYGVIVHLISNRGIKSVGLGEEKEGFHLEAEMKKLTCILGLPAGNNNNHHHHHHHHHHLLLQGCERKKKTKRGKSENQPQSHCKSKDLVDDDDNPFSRFAYKQTKMPLSKEKQQHHHHHHHQVSKKKKKDCLTATQKLVDAYKKKTPDNMWKPPRSHYNLIQEDHIHDPWRVVAICILLNMTQGVQVRGVISDFFSLCPDAQTTTQVPVEMIEKLITPLGLQRVKSKRIRNFSEAYLRDDWTHIAQLYGVGKYAADAYAIFVTAGVNMSMNGEDGDGIHGEEDESVNDDVFAVGFLASNLYLPTVYGAIEKMVYYFIFMYTDRRIRNPFILSSRTEMEEDI
ncbi:hypothetical protein E3N88_19952 [Mikania micrantha]|uniref:HhH-GPD domain-containing protein n=1 Tax=Mikania micrantha TaxID=192012 RepID=A0A5N6NFN3_9ASTR|nr:hypothetical protein E3N88_19952 [Mikania micrantha]